MPLTAQEAMKNLVSDELRPWMAERGFGKKAFTFHRKRDENFALIQFQKSSFSSATSIDFTINVSVFSRSLHRELGLLGWVPEVGKVPNEPHCHLRQRIGGLLPDEGRDVWWTIDASTDRATLGATLRDIVDRCALPFLARCETDEGLRDLLLSDDPSRSTIPTLAALVLLRDLGPREALLGRLRELRSSTLLATNGPFLAKLDAFERTMGSK